MIAVLDHVKLAGRIKCHVVWIRELSLLVPRLADGANFRAIARVNLDAVVGRIDDVKVSVRSKAQCPDTAEFSRPGSRRAPALQELPGSIELGDAMVISELRQVIIAVL